MNADIGALLGLQAQDDISDELDIRLAALGPRRTELEQVHQRAVAALAAARLAVENEERAQRELQLRVAEHRQMHERNVHQMDQVRNVREATAATSQIESARRILADEEGQLQTIARRLTDFRGIVDARESDLLSLDEAQAIARGQLDTEHAALTRERESLASPATLRLLQCRARRSRNTIVRVPVVARPRCLRCAAIRADVATTPCPCSAAG